LSRCLVRVSNKEVSMAETIVAEGRLKCPGTIKKGSLAGKECRRTLLVKHPELGWCIPCDRSPDLHPLLSILRDLMKRGELDEREVLAIIQKENRRDAMQSKKIEALEKIIGEALRDAAKDTAHTTVIKLRTIGRKGPFERDNYYRFSTDTFIKIQNGILVFKTKMLYPRADEPDPINYVPLDNVEHIEISKFSICRP